MINDQKFKVGRSDADGHHPGTKIRATLLNFSDRWETGGSTCNNSK
jgi:hypothetical protein